MRVVIQRVSEAGVSIDGKVKSAIKKGLLILLGIEDADGDEDIQWLCSKIVGLRIFDDKDGVMNLPIIEINGGILLVSQFTLHASTKKGNRPSYLKASKPAIAIPLYEKFIHCLEETFHQPIQTGEFGANMQVELVNDGPVTIFIDSQRRE